MIKQLMKTTLLKMIILFILITVVFFIYLGSNDNSIIFQLLGITKDNDEFNIELLRMIFCESYILLTIILVITFFINLEIFKNYKVIIVDKAGYSFLFVGATTIALCFYDTFVASLWGVLSFYIILAKSYMNQKICVGFEWQDEIRNHCNIKDKVMYVTDYKFECYSYLLSEKLIIHKKCIVFKGRTLNMNNIKEIKSLLSKNISELNEDDLKIIDMLII